MGQQIPSEVEQKEMWFLMFLHECILGGGGGGDEGLLSYACSLAQVK